ncbi:GmrSD restriction endonuclease domain-containing protein [Streptomyces sp. Qhu_M48]|uniref:GmrSD restriction endonuclease domain-containing protein n=1 Tax=Streptomyces sp. Qhu_M48 TaxID=3435889 RepID=UPI003F501FCB
MTDEAFSIDKRPLRDLLRQVEEGRAQLPEFQRGWVWPHPNITALLASVSQGFPVGTVMTLQAGGDVRFKHRPIEGATPPLGTEPETLVLDGQQRLTSLFQSIKLGTPVVTQDVRKHRVTGWFYVDMRAVLDEQTDREDAIRFLPEDRIVKNFRGEVLHDYSTREKEYEAHLFPLSSVLDPYDWRRGFEEHWWDRDKESLRVWRRFEERFVMNFDRYQVPVISLGKNTARQAVCQVFENVNTGGVSLTVFELLTATFAADEFDLRRHWEKEVKASWHAPEYRIIKDVSNTDFLQSVTLLATSARRDDAVARGVAEDRLPRIGCKRKDMLELRLDEYERFAPLVVQGFKRAAKFLHQQFVFDTRFLPYGTQLIPLAAILALAGEDAQSAGAQHKLARWYWCGVFGELYGGSTETRFSHDLPDVVGWIRGTSGEPRTIEAAEFAPSRLLTLRTRNSAAYKGIYALLLKAGAMDWRTGEKAEITGYFDESIDIHHIFPKVWCETAGKDPARYNSIVNKTPLTARTNRIIGGNAPSDYLVKLARSAESTPEVVHGHIRSHLVAPELMALDDFPAFFAARKAALLARVSSEMGKVIVDDGADTVALEEVGVDIDAEELAEAV